MLWFLHLLAYLPLQVVTWAITPLLPLFTEVRAGACCNGTHTAAGPRLKTWLWMFDTYDNTLNGDQNFFGKTHEWPAYLRHVRWLYRNSLYGFKLFALGEEASHLDPFVATGDPRVNRNNGITGVFYCRVSGTRVWQLKVVKKLIGNWGIMWNFGWQLDEFISHDRAGIALFQFSPRFVTIK